MCGCENSVVETELGSADFLFEKDKITCAGCGHQGLVVVENNVAYAIWHSVEAFRTYTQSEERD
ncbi:hypothetical protein NTP67_21740 (plasmid) [Providencia rettgeri]|uniref:hypothetical protein n=1 Tax=Providencia rettgeri TaxID=587 RepID=UPI00221EEDF9|nr:hypothetical protein [Providencia rettgeri]UYV43792.1 hypothetical protein NTP67_21740 [Providencia rettgeri]